LAGPGRQGQTMQALYYDRDGRRVGRDYWVQLSRRPEDSRVDHAEVMRQGREITVVTFWLGVTGCDEPGPPLIFRSYGDIRRPGDQRATYQKVWGWACLEAARAGHQAVLAWLAAVADWLAGQAGELPPPPGQAAPVAPAGEGR
jgi:hypothetical protein